MKKAVLANKPLKDLENKSICLLFYEPSTRTRLSFEQAALKLGATVVTTENARDFSSAAKGETIIDTMKVVNANHFDAAVMRTDYEGAAKEAASVATIPVINAGDGSGQHPTQALLDIATIYERFGKLDNLKIALAGDLLNGRTARSLSYLLCKFKNNRLFLVAPKAFQMKKDILEYFDEQKIAYSIHDKLSEVADKADVIYITRLQTERLKDKGQTVDGNGVRINQEVMAKLKKTSVVMHPLPRSNAFNELSDEWINDPRVIVFEQVEHGLYSRMALLKLVLKEG